MLRVFQYFVLSLAFFLQTNNSAFTQTSSLSAEEWTKKLSNPADKENKWFYELFPVLDKLDSGKVFYFFNQLEVMQTKKIITLLPGLTVQGKSTTALPLFEMDYNTSNGLGGETTDGGIQIKTRLNT